MANSGRGGYRDGSGRPSNWILRPITVVKIPEPIKDRVLDFAHSLDDSDSNSGFSEGQADKVTLSKESIEQAINDILRDVTVTRNGKDRASVKRGLLALVKTLGIQISYR